VAAGRLSEGPRLPRQRPAGVVLIRARTNRTGAVREAWPRTPSTLSWTPRVAWIGRAVAAPD